MSNVDAVLKVTKQLTSGVLSHRQFTSGEINYLVREFDQDTQNNLDKCLRINESVSLIEDAYTPNLCNACDSDPKNINDRLSQVLDKAKGLLDIETRFQELRKSSVVEQVDKLHKLKDECAIRCRQKFEKLQESIVRQELELEKRYLGFEETLCNK